MNIYNKNYFNLKKIDTTQIIYGFFSKEGGFSKQNAEVCKWYLKKNIQPLIKIVKKEH